MATQRAGLVGLVQTSCRLGLVASMLVAWLAAWLLVWLLAWLLVWLRLQLRLWLLVRRAGVSPWVRCSEVLNRRRRRHQRLRAWLTASLLLPWREPHLGLAPL